MSYTVHLKSINILVFLLVAYPFSHFEIISFKIAGVSSVFLRDIVFTSILVFFLLINFKTKIEINRKTRNIIVFYIAFTFYCFLSFLLSDTRMLVLPFIYRLIIISLLLFSLFMVDCSTLNIQQLFKSLYISFSGYCSLSLLLTPILGFADEGGLNGIAGQHFSKFIFVLSSIFFLTCFARGGKNMRDLFFLSISVICLILVLQRGAIISLIVAMLVILMSGSVKTKFYGAIIFTITFFSVVYYLMSNEAIMQYAFFDSYGPEVILSNIINGTFDWHMIRARGRFEIIEILTGSGSISFLGLGAGYSKSILETMFFVGKEPHNDMLFLLYDFGWFGFMLFMLFELSIQRVQVDYKTLSRKEEILIVFSKASFLGFTFWMMVSNVLIYMTYAFMIPIFVMFFTLNSRKRHINTKANLPLDGI